jgi:hypothetical protein
MKLGLGQLGPTEITGTKNAAQQKRADARISQGQPLDEQDRFRFGVITEVNDNNLVKVKFLGKNGQPDGEDISNGVFLPVINPLHVVHLMFGALRKGLICRVWWRGKVEPDPSTTFVEIIADEDHNFLKKEPEDNELTTGPSKIFSGGLL